MPKLPLTSLEQDVLRVLTEARVTTSVVTLAADLWRTSPDWAAWDVEPLVTWTLESLAARDIVTYIEQPIVDVVQTSTFIKQLGRDKMRDHYLRRSLATRIRLTSKGWAVMGYPNRSVEVGSFQRHLAPALHPGDMTNYRNHAGWAIGGPIEKEDLATHMDRFPSHIHDLNGDDDMPRPYTKVTPEIEAAVLAVRQVDPTASYDEVADRADVPLRTVKYVLTDLPRLRRLSDPEEVNAKSLKQRIIWALEGLGEIHDIRELSRVLGRADSDHDIVHVLHSLHTQGKVDFKGGSNGDAPLNIKLTRRGRGLAMKRTKPLGLVLEEQMDRAPVEPEPEASVTTTPEPEPDKPTYPLLDGLLDRERNRQAQDAKAMAYVTAAEALEGVDPEAAKDLMNKADALNVTFPSPLEREYITYVANHP